SLLCLFGPPALFYPRQSLGLLPWRRDCRSSTPPASAKVQIWTKSLSRQTVGTPHGTGLQGISERVSCGFDCSCSASPQTTTVAGIQSVFVAGAAGESPIWGADRPLCDMPRQRNPSADSAYGRRAQEKRTGRVRDTSCQIIERKKLTAGGRCLHLRRDGE